MANAECTNPEYDICIANVGQGSKYNNSIEDTDLRRIGCITHAGDIDRNSAWNVLGYSEYCNKMVKVMGEYHQPHRPRVVHMNKEVTQGMSGGPWMDVEFNGANGVTAGNSVYKPGTAVSPYFDDALLHAVNY